MRVMVPSPFWNTDAYVSRTLLSCVDMTSVDIVRILDQSNRMCWSQSRPKSAEPSPDTITKSYCTGGTNQVGLIHQILRSV